MFGSPDQPAAPAAHRHDASARPRTVLNVLNIEFPATPRMPSAPRFGLAMVVAVAGSLAACAVLAKLGTAVFPSTAGYPHFRFDDYAKLTVIGVVVACLAWPVVARISTSARTLFRWLTVLVTLGGLAPDAWILYKGQPPEAVAVLVAMHLALALVTYPALVLIAPQRRRPVGSERAPA